MTLELSAPTWPARVIAVECTVDAIARGRAAEFRKSGLYLEGSASVASALIELGRDPGAAALVPSDLRGMAARDFIEVVRTLTAAPAILGLVPGGVEPFEPAPDDAVPLPVTPGRLARALELARPTRVEPIAECHEVGGLHLEVASLRVHWHGDEVAVPPRLFELLRYLAAAHPRLVSVEELVSEFGASVQTPPDPGARVRVMIGRLRTIFTVARPDLPAPVETVRGLGYRLSSD